jgi:hypothetical protein
MKPERVAYSSGFHLPEDLKVGLPQPRGSSWEHLILRSYPTETNNEVSLNDQFPVEIEIIHEQESLPTIA